MLCLTKKEWDLKKIDIIPIMNKEQMIRCFSIMRNRIEINALSLGALVNPKNTFQVRSYEIDESSRIFAIPEDFSILKPYVRDVLVNAAIRNGIEDFEYLLCCIYVYLSQLPQKAVSQQEIDKFSRENFHNKLLKVDKLLDGKLTPYLDIWKNIQYVRNAITHHGSNMVKNEVILYIPTSQFDMRTEQKMIQDPITKEKRINIQMEIIPKFITKKFKKNERIEFSDTEINGLLIGLYNSIEWLQKIVIV